MAQDEQNTAEMVVRHALAPLLRAGIDARGLILAGEAAETIVAQSRGVARQYDYNGPSSPVAAQPSAEKAR